MPWGIDPARMLVQHRESKTSVWYMPEDRSGGAGTVEKAVYSGLREAVDMIIADGGRHDGYDVHVHQPSGVDRVLSQEEVHALIDHVSNNGSG